MPERVPDGPPILRDHAGNGAGIGPAFDHRGYGCRGEPSASMVPSGLRRLPCDLSTRHAVSPAGRVPPSSFVMAATAPRSASEAEHRSFRALAAACSRYGLPVANHLIVVG